MTASRFFWLIVCGGAGAAALVWIGWWKSGKGEREIPAGLRYAVPADCRQMVVVQPDAIVGVSAQVYLLERIRDLAPWKIVAGPLPAVVGKRGVAWGMGEPGLPNPGVYPDKKEGDGRSPAGIFRLSGAFGTSPQAPPGVKLPWLECTPTLRGVDDVKSEYYNRVVDEDTIPDKDWDSAEIMRRDDGAYEMGVLIDHNAGRRAGAGSCIFLHLWKGPDQGTAGCTALAREDILKILTWLDPAMKPRLALGVR